MIALALILTTRGFCSRFDLAPSLETVLLFSSRLMVLQFSICNSIPVFEFKFLSFQNNMAGLTCRNTVVILPSISSCFTTHKRCRQLHSVDNAQHTCSCHFAYLLLSIWPNAFVYPPQELLRRLVAFRKVGSLWYACVTKLLSALVTLPVCVTR